MLFSWARDVASRDRATLTYTCAQDEEKGMTLSRQCDFMTSSSPSLVEQEVQRESGACRASRAPKPSRIKTKVTHAQQEKGSRDAKMPGTKDVLISHK